MSVLEIKGALAKLLATENLIVQHDAVSTASFNTATRVLTLPILQIDNQNVYDMFIGHEVGHALYTPSDWRDLIPKDVPFDFVNVVEDARIETMIQEKFPGLRKDFSLGYTHLNDKDFFEISDKDLSKLSLIDRINLHFKLGDRALIPFTQEELVYVNDVANCVTFDDVCRVSDDISKFMKQKRSEEQQEPENVNGKPGDKESPDDTDGPQSQSMDDGDGDGENDSIESQKDGGGKQGGDDKSQTQRAFDENMERNTDDSKRVVYLKTPSSPIDIFPLEFIRQDFAESRAKIIDPSKLDNEYAEFMASIKRDVTFMVQQFEMKKSADAYARQSIHKTGVLNTNALHLYKLTDDVFLRQTVTPEGKNHGLVMLLDWSGSMSDHIVSTVKQLLILVQFCRKVNIPFDVYTFTSGSVERFLDIDKIGEVSTCGVNMCHVLSSSVSRRLIDEDMRNLYSQAKRIAYQFFPAPWSGALSMGGTPLNNVLFSMPQVIQDFQQRTGAQKVSFVCLTDGDSHPTHYTDLYNNGDVYPRMVSYFDTLILRDGRHTYKLDAMKETPSIVRWLTQKMPHVTVTNIFLAGPKGADRYARSLGGELHDFKKNGSSCFSMKEGWPLVALINPNTFKDPQAEIDVDQGASKAQIKTALKKFLKTKSSSKTLLSALVDQFS